jgi:hypothetical protein
VISFPVQEITGLGQLPCANPPTPVDSASTWATIPVTESTVPVTESTVPLVPENWTHIPPESVAHLPAESVAHFPPESVAHFDRNTHRASGDRDGQMVERSYVVEDGDILEFHL